MRRLILVTLFFLLALQIAYAANMGNPTETFYCQIGGGGLGLQIPRSNNNITFDYDSGLLNSSLTTLYHSEGTNRGSFSFNSSNVCGLTITFNELDVSITQDGAAFATSIDSESSFSFSANRRYVIFWDVQIFDPFEAFTMSGIGLTGIILTCFGAFWASRKLRDWDGVNTVFGLGIGFVLCLIGLCLMVVWLW